MVELLRDRIPLPEDEPVAEDLMQIVGIVALVLALANQFVVHGPPILTGVLLVGGLLWYLVGTYLKTLR